MLNKSIILPPLLFFIDYSAYILLDAPLVLSLACYTVVQLLASKRAHATFYTSIFFLGLSSFTFYGNIGIIYVALLPILMSSYIAKKWLKFSPWVIACTLCLFMLTQNSLLFLILGQKTPLKSYTIWQFCVNISIVLSMSLIICVAGKRDNRL